MNVTLVTQFFSPEPCAASNRAMALCRELRARGNDVTVITGFPTFPVGRRCTSDCGAARRTESIEGIRVVRLAALESARIPGGRLLSWLSFALAAGLHLMISSARIEILIVSTPPITLALTALLAKVRHRCRLVVDVRDVFPDIAVAMGAWQRNGPTATIVGWVARTLYRMADLVVAVTPTALALIARRGVPAQRLILSPNGFDRSELPSVSTRRDTRCLQATYAGNLGIATGIDVVLDAAGCLRGDPTIRFVIAGSGVEAPRVADRIRCEGLNNVRMLGVLSRAAALELMARSDVALIPLRAGIRESVPTKIFDALALGCPVVVCAEGEASRLVYASGGGVVVPPGDGTALANALRDVARDERGRRAMGERGRSYISEQYERGRIMSRLCDRILDSGRSSLGDIARTILHSFEQSA